MTIKQTCFHKIALLLTAISLLSACGSSSSSSSIPTSIPATEVAYYAHNLVFRNSTTLSVGYNGYGQLGLITVLNTDDFGNRSVPVYITGNLLFSGFATGGNHSLAFFNNSTVRSWGNNRLGQLGLGSTNTLTHSSVPVKVDGLILVKLLAAGGDHSLALKGDDTLWAWGSNERRQLGVTAAAPSGYSKTPVRVGAGVPGFSGISSIAAGGRFSLARASGSVYAWGENIKGQIGKPLTFASYSIPWRVGVNETQPLTGVVGIAAGGATAYAIASDKTLWAWGNSNTGQLGNGSKIATYVPVKVQKSTGGDLTGVVHVAAGIQHALARLDSGEVWAWGYNSLGQLGSGLLTDSAVAVKVVLTPAATDIRAFGSSSMARAGGVWYVWGDNSYGQLGTGTTGKILLPEKMSGL